MVARLSIEKVNPDDLHLDALPRATGRAFLHLAELPLLKDTHWYLAGGTALALQVGHRKSVDLDFFTTQKMFDQEALIAELGATKEWTTSLQREGTLYGTLLKAKMS
ncbi:MAG: nucleotidyl transferase AbiEii/AbiGii toxin family protein, partial [Patescibacteria group bacterium]|nr:nucleotidyl transferase AbiEii/AbiGii toxin family protein [Patescibacteria group bacterium]